MTMNGTAMNAKVLLVEDHNTLAESLSRLLIGEGYHVTVAATLAEARARLADRPSLIILDWMLPDGQGIDLLRELRANDPMTPVLLLTARTDIVDKVLGLEMGANDYLTKPFEPRELAARMRVQLRMCGIRAPNAPASPESRVIRYAGIALDPITREVTYDGRFVELTKMEYDLLFLLLQHPNRVFPREALLNKVWGYDNYPTTRTVDNHFAQLRHKLDPDLFETVRGVGYRLREAKR